MREALKIEVPGADPGVVSALLDRPEEEASALLLLAHGAGGGMDHAFLESFSGALAERAVAVLRYNFPYKEGKGWPPDRPSVAVATVRAAVERARALVAEGGMLEGARLYAGGKSFGGRMTSTAAAGERGLPGVEGIIFVGFPLHTKKRPGTGRADHLADVGVPMLFLQGTRDELADLELLRPVVEGLGKPATLHVVEGADHGFHVLKRSGRTDEEVLEELAETVSGWMAR